MSLADFGITEQRINLIFILFVAVCVVLFLISLFTARESLKSSSEKVDSPWKTSLLGAVMAV